MTLTTDFEDVQDFAHPTHLAHDRNLRDVREILVPTDLTFECRKTIYYAVGLAKKWNAHLTLLHVYKEPYSLEYMRGPSVCAAREQQRVYMENALEVLGNQVKEQYANCSTEFRAGALCDGIGNVVKELRIDLIIIGTRGNKWFQRVAYGCQADEIVRVAPCPVLIVR
jgi:nucleotide-binding universal stress UspA family protein